MSSIRFSALLASAAAMAACGSSSGNLRELGPWDYYDFYLTGAATVGTLTVGDEGAGAQLSTRSLDVRVAVDGRLARTEVVQVFQNDREVLVRAKEAS